MKTVFATAFMLTLTACGAANGDAETATAPEAEEPATAVETGTAPSEETTEPEAAEPAPAKITVAGTIDSIVLDGEEPLVIVTGSDGTNYLAVPAPGAIDTILDTTKGIGSAISLECSKGNLPPEDGYTWVEGCTLS